MFICICNALRDKDFKRAADSCIGADCAERLFDELGCKPQCGNCLCAVDEMIAPSSKTALLSTESKAAPVTA